VKLIAPESDPGFPGAGTELHRAPRRLAMPSRAAFPEEETEKEVTEPEALIDA